MHQISSRTAGDLTTIEVDGQLGVVVAHDLHRHVVTAARGGARQVELDLSRVSDIDEDGAQGLMRCCETAIASGVALFLSGCSRPSVEALGALHRRARRDPHARRRPA